MTIEIVKIDRNIPIPPRGEFIEGRITKYPFERMQPGDSFALKAEDPKKLEVKRITALATFRRWQSQRPDRATLRAVSRTNGSDTARIWLTRVEEQAAA